MRYATALMVGTLCGGCGGIVSVDAPSGGGRDSSDAGSEGSDGESGKSDTSTSDTGAPPATGDTTAADDTTGGEQTSVEFIDVTVEAGLDYALEPRQVAPNCLIDSPSTSGEPNTGAMCDPEYMMGGGAVGDYDGDGWPDLYVTRTRNTDILFRNRGDGTFEDVTTEVGLDMHRQSAGAGWADLDNDGDVDLYVSALGEPRYSLFINDGTGRFAEDAIARGLALETGELHVGTTISFGDYDLDGWLDVYVGEWRPANTAAPDSPGHARLFRNHGDSAPGNFEDVTAAAGLDMTDVHAIGVWAFGTAFVDLDEDGWPDLPIAADFGASRLFWNARDGTFVDGTDAALVGTDENGMGSAFADFDRDGRIDWLVTAIFDPDMNCELQPCNWGSTGNRLYRALPGRVFEDATDRLGIRDGGWGWGVAPIDWDNDGDQDVVMTNGWIYPNADITEPFHHDPMRAWESEDGSSMHDVAAKIGFTDDGQGRGLLTFDYDRDGDLDVFLVNNAEGPILYRNDGGNAGHWLDVRLSGTVSNAEGYGAVIEVDVGQAVPLVHQMGVASHWLGQSERTAHFGLGDRTDRVRSVTVRWPASGFEQTLYDVEPDTTLLVVEG